MKWRCLLNSCHRMVWQEGGMAFCGAGEDETSRCPIRRNTPGFCYIMPALSRFMIYLSENSSCWVEPITILSNNVFLLLHSSAKQVKTELPEWIYPTLLCREYTLKIGWREEIYWPLAWRHKKVYLMFEAAPAFVLMPEVQWKAAVGVTSGICCSLAPLICPSADTAALLSTHTPIDTLLKIRRKGFLCLPYIALHSELY